MKTIDNMKRGTLELLILSLLCEEDMYGFQISQLFASRSKNNFVVPEGTLYPALYRLVKEDYISDYKKQVGERKMRVYYHIEPKGKEFLEEISTAYRTMIQSIDDIISGDTSDDTKAQ